MDKNIDKPDAISDLLEALRALATPIPLTVDLWSTREVAQFLKHTEKTTRDKIVAKPDFPRPIRISTGARGRGHPRWKAREVIAWAEKQQER